MPDQCATQFSSFGFADGPSTDSRTSCMADSLIAYLTACLIACLLTCLSACLPACLPAFLSASLCPPRPPSFHAGTLLLAVPSTTWQCSEGVEDRPASARAGRLRDGEVRQRAHRGSHHLGQVGLRAVHEAQRECGRGARLAALPQ